MPTQGQVVEVLNCHTGGLGMLRWAELVVPQNLLARAPDPQSTHFPQRLSDRCWVKEGTGSSAEEPCNPTGSGGAGVQGLRPVVLDSPSWSDLEPCL